MTYGTCSEQTASGDELRVTVQMDLESFQGVEPETVVRKILVQGINWAGTFYNVTSSGIESINFGE